MSYSLQKTIAYFSKKDTFSINDSTLGVQIFGATGSGKTTGSGKFLATSFLRAGYGGLVLTVKTDEREVWEKYCQQTGRELLVFSPDSEWKFNFLEYEQKRKGGGITENIVNLFLSIIEVDSKKGKVQTEDFWQNTLKQMLRNAIDLISISEEDLSVYNIYKVISSAPQKPEDTEMIEDENGEEFLTRWMQTSYCNELIEKAGARNLDSSKKQDFDIVFDYWVKEFPNLANDTRSSIVASFTSIADIFLRGILRDMFTTTTNIFPEFSLEGVVILIDFPVHQYDKVGQYAQLVFKYVWQKAMERREKKKDMRPVFLWADEAQFFINEYDVNFQTTARSSRACTVYLTQNLPNYTEKLGEDLTYSLLGNLQTKIFHQNSDSITNNYASNLIGKDIQYRANSGANASSGESSSVNTGFNEVMDFDLQPREFTNLKKGGESNNFIVEGVVYKSGEIWQANNKNYLKLGFPQKFK